MSPPSERAPSTSKPKSASNPLGGGGPSRSQSQLETARARRLEVNFDEPIGIDVGGAVLARLCDVELLPRDSGEAPGHAHAD